MNAQVFGMHEIGPYPGPVEAKRSAAIIVALLTAGAVLALLFQPAGKNIPGYLPLHMLFETFAIVVAILVFSAGWHAYKRNLPGNIVLLGCTFLGVGLLDFAHMLSYSGMPDFVTPNSADKCIDFWLAARSLAGIGILAAAITPWRPFSSPQTRYLLAATVLAVTAFIYWLFLFHQDVMPPAFIPGKGLTAFKITAEYVLIGLYLAAAFALWKRMHKPQSFDQAVLFCAASSMALSEFFFTRYLTLTDAFNLLGHVYKVIAYLFLYRAIFVEAIEKPYRQLHASETRLHTLYDSTNDAVMLLDEKGFFDCNKATLALFGCPAKEDFCSKHPADLSPLAQPCGTDSMTLINRQIAKALEKGSNFFEWMHLRADNGKAFPAEVLLDRMVLEGRVMLQATVRDITSRKKAEEMLKESEEKFRRLFEDAADPVLLLKEGRFIDCNSATLSLLGYESKEKFINSSPASISPPLQPDGRASAEKSAEMDAIALREGFNRFEWMHQRRNGSDIPIEVTLTSVSMEGERILHVHWRDITERKNNEAKIERLSRIYRLLSHVNEAIVHSSSKSELFTDICDAAMKSGLFQLAWIGLVDKSKSRLEPVTSSRMEDNFISLLDIRLDDERYCNWPIVTAIRDNVHLVKQNMDELPHIIPWRDEAIKRGLQSAGIFPIHEAKAVAGSINVYATDKHFFTPDIIQLMQELSADVSFALEVISERTRREQAEAETIRINTELERRVIARTRELELVNRELEAFCYSVSHDLRAPLRSIDGFSQILLKKNHAQLDAMGKDYLERVCRASQRMGSLIDDLLQLSKVTRGALERKPVDLSAIVEEVTEDLRKAHPERTVHFTLQPGLTAHADHGLLRIVMDNLLGNAFKYTSKKPDAEIGFGAQELNGERVFFVRDNGAGFSMDYAHKLFAPFQRLHTAKEFEGTGIGLATVQRIINRHHGKVWAEAEEEKGAVFYFTLPQRENERQEKMV